MPKRFVTADWLRSRRGTRWKLWDLLVGTAAFAIAFQVSPYTVEMPASYYLLIVGGLHGVLLLTFSRLSGVPAPEQRTTIYELVAHAAVATLLTYLVFSTIVWFVLVRVYGRYIVLTLEAVSFIGLVVPRWLVRRHLQINPLHVLIYGAGRTGQALCRRLSELPQFAVMGFVDEDRTHHAQMVGETRVFGGIEDISESELQRSRIDLVVVCVGDTLKRRNAERLLRLPLQGIEVLNVGAFLEHYFRQIAVEYRNPHWFVSTPSVPGTPSLFTAKRALDLGVAVAGLLMTLPLWPLIALLIKLDGRGSVFYRQTRVGWRGREFELIKFRTMRPDAEPDGAQWATKDDPRVTRSGRFLRLTRLDELPQLWNVLKGDMAIVGPRPERPEFVRELTAAIPFYEQRHLVPPGLTGWAQITYSYGASVDDARRKLEYDLYYVRHMSLAFDIEIILRTVPLLMKGSR